MRSGRPSHQPFAAVLCAAMLTVPGLAAAQTEAEPVPAPADNVVVLDPIVITAGGFEQTLREAPASVSVITSDELAKGSFSSLTDALTEVQGVVSTGSANERDIYIRGLPGEYTLILVDGKRQGTRDARTNGAAGIEQSFIPPVAAIDRIEVVRGPMSSLYGSDAMGGVINIITKPVADVWSGSATVETTLQGEDGFENSQQQSVYLSGPLIADKLGLQVWGRRFQQDASDLEGGPNASDDFDIGGRLSYRINESNQLLFEAGRTRVRNTEFGDLTYRDNDRDHYSLTHKGSYGDLETELSLSQEIGERTTYDRMDPSAGYVANLRSPEVRNTVVDAKGSMPLSWRGQHQLTFGAQFIRNTLKDQNPGAQANLPEEQRYDEKFSIDQRAIYIEDEWRLRDDLALTLGLRYSDHEIYGGKFNPRIYAVWDATSQLTVKGGVSTGYRAPDLRDITPGYAYTTGGRGCASNNPPSCGVILGNTDLDPEETVNFEVGAVYEGDSFNVSATAFHTRFKNKLAQVVTDEYWTDGPQYTAADGNAYDYRIYRSFNVDRAEITGLELAGDWDITDNLSARASYTYTRSRQKTGDFEGFPLARTPEHLASLRLDWRTPVTELDVWARATYRGSEIASGLRIGNAGRPITINGAEGRKYAPYTTVDLGANYRINDNAVLNAAVYNAFNEKISEAEFNTVEEGRRLWLGVTTDF